MATRQRATELARESARRSTSVAIVLGRELARTRRARRLSQRAVAARIGVNQSTYSRMERGLGIRVPLDTWIAVGIALDRPLAVSLTRALGESAHGPIDAGHLRIQDHLLALARAVGRRGMFELPSRPSDPLRSTDVGIRDDRHRTLIQAECWNTFGDLGAAVRATNRKQAETTTHATATQRPGHPEPYRVASVWVVRASAANRSTLARYPHVFASAFPGSSRSWVRALVDGAEPPRDPGLVWFDAATGRLTEWRHR